MNELQSDWWMTGWMDGWMNEWHNYWLFDWLTDWLTDRMNNGWMSGWMNCRMNCRMTDWLTDWLTDWRNGWMDEWIINFINLTIYSSMQCSNWGERVNERITHLPSYLLHTRTANSPKCVPTRARVCKPSQNARQASLNKKRAIRGYCARSHFILCDTCSTIVERFLSTPCVRTVQRSAHARNVYITCKLTYSALVFFPRINEATVGVSGSEHWRWDCAQLLRWTRNTSWTHR